MSFAKRSWLALGLGTLGFIGCGGADWDQTAQQVETTDDSAEFTSSKSFLSLGNSIAFGLNPLVNPPGNPSSYIGYPEVIASKGYKVTNPSCPGETSSSFLSAMAPDNGCRQWKAAFALHADYETTQIAFTLAAVKKTRYDFVTLDLGANDLFLLQATCGDDPICIQNGLPGVIGTYTQNLNDGYNQVKSACGGNCSRTRFVGLTTYVLNYNDPLSVGALTALNNALKSFTTQIGGKTADGFAAFKNASAGSNGDACAAGLVIQKPDGTCDVHPSQKGRELLAATILCAVGLQSKNCPNVN